MDDSRFTELLARARGGDGDAAAELVAAFGAMVRARVRERLPRLLQPQVDSVDIAQCVWASIFVGRAGATPFGGAEQFQAFVVGMARNKVREAYRRRTRRRRFALRPEEPLYVVRNGAEAPRPIAAPDPTPSQQAQAAERLARLLAGRSRVEVEAVELRRQGRTYREVAESLGVHERTVRRMLAALAEEAGLEAGAP